jgi:hypothetical protein
MNPDLVAQGDLSAEIAKLRELINKAEGQPALQRSLIETLNRVCRDQDHRNLFYSHVLGRETALSFAQSCCDAVARVLTEECGDDRERYYRLMDRVDEELRRIGEPTNTKADLKLLKSG